MSSQTPSYYVPEQSKLPISMVVVLAFMMIGLGHTILGDEGWAYGPLFAVLGFAGFLTVLFFWFSQVIEENHAGLNSDQMKTSYVWGMSWFIVSEIFFFIGFFGALFYIRMFAVPWLGGEGDKGVANLLWQGFQANWPLLSNPNNEAFVAPAQDMSWPGLGGLLTWIPLWNTIFLVTSSVTVTIAHEHLKHDNRSKFNLWLSISLVLAFIFLCLQVYEYFHAYTELGLTLDSGVYGSTFFLLTGFHGAHVTLGTIMLSVMLLRSLKGHFKKDDHFGFEAASWYWHFVDVVWVGLFFFVYCI